MMRHWKIGPLALLLTACGAAPTSPTPPAAVTVVTANADGTRTFARKVGGLLEGRTIVCTASGEIADIFHFQHDKPEGVQLRFYPGGRLATWQQMHAGHPHGSSYSFLENGALATVEHYDAGIRTGRNSLFYARPANSLHKLVDLIPIAGKEWQNGYAEYDTTGRVLTRTGFLQIRAVRDTVSLGDSLVLHLRIRYPEHPLIAAAIGDFDKQFRLQEASSLRVLAGRQHVVRAAFLATKRGPQMARGYLIDYQQIGSAIKKSQPSPEGQRLYFAYPYLVQ